VTDHTMMVKCPACGAGPGYPCKTINGHHMPAPHTKRILAAKKPPEQAEEHGCHSEGEQV
jgi:hypothetical protein